jgi:hypothetical protein
VADKINKGPTSKTGSKDRRKIVDRKIQLPPGRQVSKDKNNHLQIITEIINKVVKNASGFIARRFLFLQHNF